MQTTIPVQEATQISLLGGAKPPKMRQLKVYVEPTMYDEISVMATAEDMDLSAITRELVSLGLLYRQRVIEVAREQDKDVPTTITELSELALNCYEEVRKRAETDQTNTLSAIRKALQFGLRYYRKVESIAVSEKIDVETATDELISYALLLWKISSSTFLPVSGRLCI